MRADKEIVAKAAIIHDSKEGNRSSKRLRDVVKVKAAETETVSKAPSGPVTKRVRKAESGILPKTPTKPTKTKKPILKLNISRKGKGRAKVVGKGEYNDELSQFKWVDNKAVVHNGVEIASTPPDLTDVLGQWKWVAQLGGDLPAKAGGIRFRLFEGDELTWGNVDGTFVYGNQHVLTFRGAERRGNRVFISLTDNVTEGLKAKLSWTVQPGGRGSGVGRLLSVRFVDPVNNTNMDLIGKKAFSLASKSSSHFGRDERLAAQDLWEFGVGTNMEAADWNEFLITKGRQKGWWSKEAARPYEFEP